MGDVNVVAQTFAAALKREDPEYYANCIWPVGNRKYHLFGRTFFDVVALQKVGKIVEKSDSTREAVALLIKAIDSVTLAYGHDAACILTGGNFNAKVGSK